MKNPFARRNPWLHAVALILVAVLCAPLLVMAVTADSTAGGTGGSSLALAGLMGAPFMLRSPASDGGEGGGGGDGPQTNDVAEVLKTANDTTLPMSQRFGVMMKALQGIDPTNQLAKVKSDLKTAQDELQSKQTDLEKMKADLDTANKRIAALTTDVSDAQAATAEAEKKAKDLEAKEQDLAKRADAMAREKMKGLGFASNKLPSASDKLPQEANLEDARKAFAEAKDPLEKAKLNKRLKEIEKKSLAGVN